jgi:hypothetical protein
MTFARNVSAFLSLLIMTLGAVMLVITLVRGGGIGVLLGLLFVAAGGGRLYLMRRAR